MDGKQYHCNYFFVLFDERGLDESSDEKEKENHNPLNYFHMGIIEEIRFFFFDMEDPAHSQKTMHRNDAKIEKQGV